MSQPNSQWLRWTIQLFLALLILAAGVGGYVGLSKMRKRPPQVQREVAAPLVAVQAVKAEDTEMIVSGYGTVQPRFEVNIVPQVAGIVVQCHANFVNGGFFQAGEPLIVIDPRDYKLAVENAGSAVATAQVRLDQERAEGAVARQEWNQLHPNEEPSSPLVVRQPQIRQAEALLQAATAQLAKANLDLERTTIAMPFPGRITQKSVDVGQYVTPGQSVAAVYSTEVVEIVIPLEDRELAWFEAPMGQSNGTTGNESSSEATVRADFEGTRHAWKGRVVRTQGKIDPCRGWLRLLWRCKSRLKSAKAVLRWFRGCSRRWRFAASRCRRSIGCRGTRSTTETRSGSPPARSWRSGRSRSFASTTRRRIFPEASTTATQW